MCSVVLQLIYMTAEVKGKLTNDCLGTLKPVPTAIFTVILRISKSKEDFG